MKYTVKASKKKNHAKQVPYGLKNQMKQLINQKKQIFKPQKGGQI